MATLTWTKTATAYVATTDRWTFCAERTPKGDRFVLLAWRKTDGPNGGKPLPGFDTITLTKRTTLKACQARAAEVRAEADERETAALGFAAAEDRRRAEAKKLADELQADLEAAYGPVDPGAAERDPMPTGWTPNPKRTAEAEAAVEDELDRRLAKPAIYEEIWVENVFPKLPDLPERCPICRAFAVKRDSVGKPWESVEYRCGGSYTSKPQIQNHTNKWWGSCPAGTKLLKEEVAVCGMPPKAKGGKIVAGPKPATPKGDGGKAVLAKPAKAWAKAWRPKPGDWVVWLPEPDLAYPVVEVGLNQATIRRDGKPLLTALIESLRPADPTKHRRRCNHSRGFFDHLLSEGCPICKPGDFIAYEALPQADEAAPDPWPEVKPAHVREALDKMAEPAAKPEAERNVLDVEDGKGRTLKILTWDGTAGLLMIRNRERKTKDVYAIRWDMTTPIERTGLVFQKVAVTAAGIVLEPCYWVGVPLPDRPDDKPSCHCRAFRERATCRHADAAVKLATMPGGI